MDKSENSLPDIATGKKLQQSLTVSTPLKSGGTEGTKYGAADGGDTKPLVPPPQRETSVFSYLKTLTVEPTLFTFVFGYIMTISCMTNMMMDKGCLYYYNYTAEVCNNLSHHEHVKSKVEILANNYGLYSNLLSLVAAFTMIFIAPWSDKYGRKLPMALATAGYIVTDVLVLLCIVYFESPLYYLVMAKVPSEIFGGFICIMTIVFSHVSEVSTEQKRTQKYTTVEIAMGLGMSLGGFAGGVMYRYYGYFYVFLGSTIMHCCSLMWTVLFLQETTGLDDVSSWEEKLKDLFKCQNITKGLKATVRPRENYGRALILMFFLSMCFIILTYESFGSIGFTYVHHIYNWDPMTFNNVTTLFGLSSMAILLICIPVLIRVFKVSDYFLGIIGILSSISKYAFVGFAHYGVYLFYIGYSIGNLGGISTLAVRSGISKIVGKDELGKVFSFLATCESILPMVGTVLITKLFNATINITPSVTYLMTGVLLLFPLGTFIWAYYLAKRQNISIQ